MTAIGNISSTGNVSASNVAATSISTSGAGRTSFTTTQNGSALAITGRDYIGNDRTWAFITSVNPTPPLGYYWMNWPDGTNQVTAYPGYANNLSLSGTITANSGFFTNSYITATGNVYGNIFLGNAASMSGNVQVGNLSAAGNVVVGNLLLSPPQAVKQVASNGTLVNPGTQTIYTAANANINAAKIVIRTQCIAPVAGVTMVEVMAVKDTANNVNFTTYGRIASNNCPNVVVTVSVNTSNVLIANAYISGNAYVTYDATEFSTS
jgi:hypothetical protein